MLFSSIFISSFAALAAAAGPSRLESFLKAHPTPSNVTVGHGTGINPTVEVKRGLGTAVLGNRCDHDIWIWSVDGQVHPLSHHHRNPSRIPTPQHRHTSNTDIQQGSSAAIQVPARSQYKEPFRTSCEGCGVVFKVSNTPELQGGQQTQFEYAISCTTTFRSWTARRARAPITALATKMGWASIHLT
jgi:hypothetical protein